MSYILDALRRADAERERERGQVPGLHSQAMAAGDAPARGSSIAPWVAAAVLAGAGISGAWWWFSFRGAAPVSSMPTAPVSSQPAAPPVATAPAPTVAAAPPALPVPSPAPTPQPAPTVAPAVAPRPATSVAPAPRVAPAPAAPAPAAATVAAPPPAEPAPSPAARVRERAASEAVPAAPVIAFDQLPEDVRRQLPAVAIGGAIYSEVPAARMLIVAGQLLREGDAVAPGVTLETIRPRSAILRWKALRYEVAF